MERLIHNPIPGSDKNAAPTFEMDRFKYPPTSSASASAPAPTSTPIANHA